MTTPIHDTPLAIALRLRGETGETDSIPDLDKLITMLRERQHDDWRRCPGCGHEGRRGSVVVSEADIGVWPVVADLHDAIWRRTEIALCSACETIDVSYTPTDDDRLDDEDRAYAKLLRPDVLSGLAGALMSVNPPEEGSNG